MAEKLFSTPHLLKEPFAQDANTLNRAFYEELLYLMGLEEVKDKGRKLIQRCVPERRQRGSLLENTLTIIYGEHLLANLSGEEVRRFGNSTETQIFGIALELCLTWINRLLFLKLLESQLGRYHGPSQAATFRILSANAVQSYDNLNKLFFRVLNASFNERSEPIKTQYQHIPYLNSSLFEPSTLENKTLKINALEDNIIR